MSHIIVCPVSRLHETIRISGSRDVLTLMKRSNGDFELCQLGVLRHKCLEFSDITEARAGYELAMPQHILQILDFSRCWNRDLPLVMHCFAGISRSTASAYIAACALMPERDEAILADELRRLSPVATPNIHVVKLADDILGRQGRMTAAIESIGRGSDAFEGNVFSMTIEP